MHSTLLGGLLTASVVFAVWSYLDLLWDIKSKDKMQPIATRIAVAGAMLLSCVSVVVGKGSLGDAFLTGVYAILALVAVWLTWGRRQGAEISLLDTNCMAISLTGAVLFAVTGQSSMGITCAILADIAAYTPTVRESWKRPATQPVRTYVIGLVAAAFALAASMTQSGGEWKITMWFTIYLLLIDAGLPVIIVSRKRIAARKATRKKEAAAL
ncbi:MAG TPA: hypothetical protein VJ841_05185 [Candidatus Saccharimonadales bacterium]|nr:hypothetical protein [Candidatus Saccharimonadales bacterium]